MLEPDRFEALDQQVFDGDRRHVAAVLRARPAGFPVGDAARGRAHLAGAPAPVAVVQPPIAEAAPPASPASPPRRRAMARQAEPAAPPTATPDDLAPSAAPEPSRLTAQLIAAAVVASAKCFGQDPEAAMAPGRGQRRRPIAPACVGLSEALMMSVAQIAPRLSADKNSVWQARSNGGERFEHAAQTAKRAVLAAIAAAGREPPTRRQIGQAGEAHPRAQLTNLQVRLIRQRYDVAKLGLKRAPTGLRQELADEFGVAVTCIDDIVSRRAWSELAD